MIFEPTTARSPVVQSSLFSRPRRQRKCACGGFAPAGGECAECQAKKRLAQRQALNGESFSTPPPPTETVSRPIGAETGASTMAEPAHDFGSVRVRRGTATEAAVIGGAPPPAAGRPRPRSLFQTPTNVSKDHRVRFSKNKSVCLVPDSFNVETRICRNNADRATGFMAISFQGRGKTRWYGGTKQPFAAGERETTDGKVCDCDCLLYRQFIRAVAFQRMSGAAAFQRIATLTSGAIPGGLPANSQWHREDSPIYGGQCDCVANYDGCERRYCDEPGFLSGLRGSEVLLRYNFLLQVWDMCEQKSVRERRLTLTIAGDAPPRVIEWDPGWLPLSQDHISISAAIAPPR